MTVTTGLSEVVAAAIVALVLVVLTPSMVSVMATRRRWSMRRTRSASQDATTASHDVPTGRRLRPPHPMPSDAPSLRTPIPQAGWPGPVVETSTTVGVLESLGVEEQTPGDMFASRTVGASSKYSGQPWRLPSSPAQSGVAADQAVVGDLVVRAASVVGIGHRLADPAVPRQDSYRLTTDSTGDYLVIAVSDGVSTAPQSELGATVACRAAVDTIRPVLDATRTVSELDPRRVFGDAARYMAGVADQRRVSQGSMAAVLVTMVVPARADRWGNRQAWCAWLGDAGVWLRDGTGWRRLAGDEKSGLDHNRVSAALPRDYRKVRCSIVPLPPGAVVSVATDGVGDAFGRDQSAAWFADRWLRPPALASFLLDVDFDAKQATDDRTAVTVWCGTAAHHE